MNLITRQSLAATALKRWRINHNTDDKSQVFTVEDHRKYLMIDIKLQQLGENPISNEVDKIIGNDSMTRIHHMCDECGYTHDKQLMLGDKENGKTFNICQSCIEKSIKLFNSK